ncbi:MAG: carbohydrate kinase family protein [Patescibacteria group bacterium]
MFDVITIGTATRDVFLRSLLFKGEIKNKKELKKLGIHAEEAACFGLGSKIGIKEPIMEIGGAAVNAATTFAKQGFKTAAFLKIGDDEAGKSIVQKLKKEKIFDLSVIDKKTKTAFSAILLSPDSERTILTYRGASETVKENEIPFNKFKSKWVYISPSKINFNLVKKIINYFYKQKILIALNPSSLMLEQGIKKLAPIFKKTKVLILNREEASYLTKMDYNNKEAMFKKLDEVIGGIFVMTDGAKGAWVSDNKNLYQIGVFTSKKVIDKTGAGDAFGSGFVSGLIRKGEKCDKGLCSADKIEYASRIATANATSCVEKIGAIPGILTKNEFEKDGRWKKINIKITRP